MQRLGTQDEWIARAREVLPGGGFGNFDPGLVIRKGLGSRVWDENGKEYIDYLIGSGPMLLGHSHPEVLEAVIEQLPKGQTFFANNAAGVELAEEIARAVSCVEQVRFVTSGSEADMYAMRLARAVTGRNRILKFEGGYHGMSAEAQMSLAPTRLVNFPDAVPDSAGIPDSLRAEMLVAPFNDIGSVRSLVSEHCDEIAAVIVEPLQRIVPPVPGFLEALREECTKAGILLVFDEIVTGFRLAYGGAQEYYGVSPDICTLGKVIGGGLPIAAIGASKDFMKHFNRSTVGEAGWLMQLGTLSGNPIAAVAGLKTLEILRRPSQYEKLRRTGETIQGMMASHLSAADIPHRIIGDATLFDVVFTDGPVRNYREVLAADGRLNSMFNASLRENCILKSPGKIYPSLALNEADLQETDDTIYFAVRALPR